MEIFKITDFWSAALISFYSSLFGSFLLSGVLAFIFHSFNKYLLIPTMYSTLMC